MSDIGDFAKVAAKRFSESQLQSRFQLELDHGTVERLVKEAFYASMIPDEGRYPSTTMMTYHADFAKALHFNFLTPVAISANEIAKLSHAAGPGEHLCLLSKANDIKIAAINVTVLDDLREYGYGSTTVANPLKIRIDGPGRIVFSTGGIALSYNAGEIAEERILQLGFVIQSLATAIRESLIGRTNGVIESLEEVFEDLTKWIVRLGHGGLVLIAKNPQMEQFSAIRQTRCELLHKLLIEYWNAVHRTVPSARMVDRRNLTTAAQFLDINSYTTKLENCIESIAMLAGMDGAIVLDFECNVVGFNAIISKQTDDGVQAEFQDASGFAIAESDVSRNRGSRFQSAMSYVKRVPNSFAIVISQDGGISTFHNRGDGIVDFEIGLKVLE